MASTHVIILKSEVKTCFKNMPFTAFIKFIEKDKRVFCSFSRASQVAPLVKNLPTNVGDARGMCLIPGLRRSSGVGNGSPLQYLCLENSMHRGAWWAAVHGVTNSWT